MEEVVKQVEKTQKQDVKKLRKIKANASRLKSRGQFKRAIAHLPYTVAWGSFGLAVATIIPIMATGMVSSVDKETFIATPEFIAEKNLREQELIEKLSNKEIDISEFNKEVRKLSTVDFIKEVYYKYNPVDAAKYDKCDKAATGLLISMAATALLFASSVLVSRNLDQRLDDLDDSGLDDIRIAERTLNEIALKEGKEVKSPRTKRDLADIVEEEWGGIDH